LIKKYFSNGKLLLSGEYLVLDGANALAIPSRYGQSLEVTVSEKEGISWTSKDINGKIWYQNEFRFAQDLLISNLKDDTSLVLLEILREAKKLNSDFLQPHFGCSVVTRLNFPREWGLGTSSTLINNISLWAGIDPFKLLNRSFGGSGYDIAIAQLSSPILFKLENANPTIIPVSLKWPFVDQLFFVHLNQKQDSKEGIAHYRSKALMIKEQITRISEISELLIRCVNLSEFEIFLEEHENIISDIIQLPTIKEQLFDDYPNVIKSLGAWGGDFVLATGSAKNQEYFRNKGYKTIITFSEMIL